MSVTDRTDGLFWGQLIGDALGTRYEFKPSITTKKELQIDIENSEKNKLEIFGGGPFNLDKGCYTDDSELALGLWYSLLVTKQVSLEHISKTYYEWLKSEPFDIGNATRAAFCGSTNYNLMKLHSYQHNRGSLSNECLMKISPLGASAILNKCKKQDLTMCAKLICELTNPHPLCIDMCKSYVMAIDTALRTGDYMETYSTAYLTAELPLTKQILTDAMDLNIPVRMPNFEVIKTADNQYAGYVGIAFQNAFYQLLKLRMKNTFYDAMIDTISLGGDTDTNACIAGALFGACVGISKIPFDWKKTVKIYNNKNKRHCKYLPLDHNYVYDLLNEYSY